MDFNEALEKLDSVAVESPKLYEFEVRVRETIVKTVYVEAYDYEDAEERVDEMIASGEIDLEHNFDDYHREYDIDCCDPDYEEDYE